MLHANQLQFNLDVPTDLWNMRTQFSSPSAIMYERLIPVPHNAAPGARLDPPRSETPLRLTRESNDRLTTAIELAKRDLKLAKRNKTLQDFAKENELEWDGASKHDVSSKDRSKHKTKMVLVPVQDTTVQIEHRPVKKLESRPKPCVQKLSKHQQEVLDIRRLRLELNQLILKLEETIEDQRSFHSQKLLTVDQEDEQRLVVRHLEQMRKSSRTVYTLQQQTQRIKDDLKKKDKQSVGATNKSKALSRLAAVHRGTVRLFQVYSKQLPEHLIFNDNFVAVNALYQEVSRLIKELALCSLQFDLTNVEDVEKLTDALKNIEPKYAPPPKLPTSPKGRTSRTPQKGPRTPQRVFKSKQFDVIRKSPVRPRLPRPSHTPIGLANRLENGDDRPVWRPPSNSPHKNVGPPPLSPLLESPLPTRTRQLKPKQVTFFSTPKGGTDLEHDIDAFHQSSPRDLKALKSQLADELEQEIKNRINPLLKQVENLAKSAETIEKPATTTKHLSPEEEILERQVREIVNETKREMQSLQRKQEIEEEALHLYQGPSLESLMSRLESINNEEEAIRRRWKEINYQDMKPECSTLSRSEHAVPKTPQPIKFTKTDRQCYREEPEKRIINFLPQEKEESTPRLVSTNGPAENKRKERCFGRTLTLPQSTLHAVEKNRRDYERHLKFTFHEPKGRFDPWQLVRELSDQILEEIVTSVSKEVNGACEDYASDIFQREFANASFSSEPSWITSDSSSSVLETPARELR